jgi:hypothetical protein
VKNRLSVSYVSRSAPHYDKLTINLLIGSSRLVDHDAATVVAQVPSSIHHRITLKLCNRTGESADARPFWRGRGYNALLEPASP